MTERTDALDPVSGAGSFVRSVLTPAFLVVLLARPALRRTDGWALTVARASVLLALLALAGALLVLAGGVVTGGIVTF